MKFHYISIISTKLRKCQTEKINKEFEKSIEQKVRSEKYYMALEYSNKSLKFCKEINDKEAIAFMYNNIALLNILFTDSLTLTKNQKLNYLNKSIEYGNKSIEIAYELEAIERINEVANTLLKAYKKINNYKKALEFADIYISTKDSLYNHEKINAVQKIENRYETEKKEQQIVMLD